MSETKYYDPLIQEYKAVNKKLKAKLQKLQQKQKNVLNYKRAESMIEDMDLEFALERCIPKNEYLIGVLEKLDTELSMHVILMK